MKKADERYASIDLLLADLIRARAELNGSAKEEKPAERKRQRLVQRRLVRQACGCPEGRGGSQTA